MHYCPITQIALVRCEATGAPFVRGAAALVTRVSKLDCCLHCLQSYGMDRAMRRGARDWAEQALGVLASAAGGHDRAIDASRKAWKSVLAPPSAKLAKTLT